MKTSGGEEFVFKIWGPGQGFTRLAHLMSHKLIRAAD